MPISQTIQLQKIEKKEYPVLPAGVYQAQIADIREKLKTPWGQPESAEKELYLTFQFTIISGKYKGQNLFKDVRPVAPTPSEGNSFKPSWMWRIVSAVMGHPFSFAEGVDFRSDQVNGLIGRQLRLIVNQTPPKDGKSYNNITEVLPVEEEMEGLADNVDSEGYVNPDNVPFE
jgi:hypothetical protein